jgi:hypothetical protein
MTENDEKIKSEKMVKMEELRKQLADLEIDAIPKEESSSDEEVVEKPKRERTEKQKQAFLKAQETRLKKAEERKREKALKDQEEKEELEKKLIEKAIKVKKKQIKKMAVIEQLSDDDTTSYGAVDKSTPIEKHKPKQVQIPKEPIKPKLRFV